MNELELIRTLYRYHFRKLRSYLRIVWSLSVAERYRDRGATFPSLVDIYLHLLDDYRFWFVRVYGGRSFEDFPLGIRLSRAEAERATRRVDRTVGKVLRGLKVEDLDRKVYVEDDRRSVTVRSILLQMIEGDLQHKGELNALLWQMGTRPPRVDFA